jgi:hypothetical protein
MIIRILNNEAAATAAETRGGSEGSSATGNAVICVARVNI